MCRGFLHFELNDTYPVTQKISHGKFYFSIFIFTSDHIQDIPKHNFVHTECLWMYSIQYRVVTKKKLIPSTVLGALNMITYITTRTHVPCVNESMQS